MSTLKRRNSEEKCTKQGFAALVVDRIASNMDHLPMETLPGEPIKREDQFIRNLAQYPTVKAAAIAAGYSESYANSNLYQRMKSESLLRKIREYYNGNAAIMLPRILDAERKVVELVHADPKELPKYRHTLRELKQSAGVLQSDTPTSQPTIKVGSIRNLVLQMQERREESLHNDAIEYSDVEGEVISQ